MDKRYQVFISSTFLDLKEERQAVSQALLRSDCFPAQMENWPAMDAEQMEAIKQIIDESDYYVLISAGKYGSISPETGLSYTEMEYDYAVKTGKPIIRLLHRDPFGALKGAQIESKASARKKLQTFHAKLKKGKVCSFWENADQLEKETILGLLDIKKRHPAKGWVSADGRANEEAELEIFRLREEISTLQNAKPDTTIQEDLDYELRFAEAVVEALSLDESRTFIFDLLQNIEKGVDEMGIRELFDLYHYMTVMDVTFEDSQLLVDALILDRIISVGASSRLAITPAGRITIAKSRLLGIAYV